MKAPPQGPPINMAQAMSGDTAIMQRSNVAKEAAKAHADAKAKAKAVG